MTAGSRGTRPVLVLVGPTASGKTELALDIAASLDAEIVSVDSVQIYRHFDVGSGKPSAEELARVPHHLISTQDPRAPLEASQFCALADEVLGELEARGKRAILCGGTFLWHRALLYGLAEAPPAQPELRAVHAELVEREGRKALHERLLSVDPESAARLHPNDFVRVSRALEVFEASGQKLSALQAAHGFRHARYQPVFVGIDWPRAEYDERLERRTRTLFERGFIEEVEALIANGYGETRPMGSVGYQQVHAALTRSSLEPEQLIQDVFQKTRVFARRQRTWLRDRDVHWLPPSVLDRRETQGLAPELQALLAPFERLAD